MQAGDEAGGGRAMASMNAPGQRRLRLHGRKEHAVRVATGRSAPGRRHAGRHTIKVSPQVLGWVIDSSGWRDGELASATGISASLIGQWRACESEISMADIRSMAGAIKQPLSSFMLAEPPREAPVAGFRPGSGSAAAGRPSRQLCSAVKRAREIQYNVRELREYATDDPAPPVDGLLAATVEHADDPERVAAGEAARMGLNGGIGVLAPAAPDRYGRTNLLYDALRDAVESRGVFVAQARFPAGEANGFAVSGEGPPVVVINSAHAVGSRIFTLFHEYAHVLLAGGSVCRPAPESLEAADSGSGKVIEGWCDAFASSVLMPRKEFLDALREEKGRTVGGALAVLSQRFFLSRRAVLVRAIGLIEGPTKDAYLDHYRKMGPLPEPRNSTGGRHAPPGVACLNRHGWRYVQMVFDSEDACSITECDMAMYLNLSARHFDGLRAKAWNG